MLSGQTQEEKRENYHHLSLPVEPGAGGSETELAGTLLLREILQDGQCTWGICISSFLGIDFC